jgi:predicted ATPase
MSHIVSFEVHGLAGRSDALTALLNRDTNIFFGPNGSGKTSLLKILHAAMANDTEILDGVPFTRAEVRIHSVTWNTVFTRSIEKKQKAKRDRAKRPEAVRRELSSWTEAVLVSEPSAEQNMKWTCEPTTPERAPATKWQHTYLPTSRLHISDEPLPSDYEYGRTARPWITEKNLDLMFARSVQHLWGRYSTQVLGAVRQAQEQGLASILRAVLSPESARTRRRSSTLTAATAYERVHSFLGRQGSGGILGKRQAFEERYEAEHTLQDVVQDIDLVEGSIKTAMAPRDKLEELITRMFAASKAIRFTDGSIEASTLDGEDIGLGSLSSGEKHLLRILVEALLVGESSMLIDEPELSMHIDWQKHLIESLRALNPDAQLVFATHSPEIMGDVPDDRIFRI